MIGEFILSLITPIGAFVYFPLLTGLHILDNYLSLNAHETVAYWIGVWIAQIWWFSILVRSHTKE